VEIKIGIQQLSRELTVESPLTPAEVETLVTEALEGSSKVLVLEDEKGRKVMVPTAQLAYVEIGELSVRRVGFGAL
jgi:pyruvate/2-oxoglutarate/acetoin dehydrogenase E1 component